MGNALRRENYAAPPVGVVSIALNPLLKRRAAEKQIVMDGDIPLVIADSIVVSLDKHFVDENRQIITSLDGDNAAKLLTYTAHRLGYLLNQGDDGLDAEHFEEDAALMFLLVLRMAGRINDTHLPECRVAYNLVEEENPVSIEML
ncbi:MAG: hypothetical protein ACR2OJ_02720 [Hyphomicrobiales bacterium]